MTINEYQKLAQRTCAIAQDRRDKLLNGCMGLIGETGEVVDALKKWRFQSGENPPFPSEKIVEECGDVLWYIAEVCSALGMPMSKLISSDERMDMNQFPEFSLSAHPIFDAIRHSITMVRLATEIENLSFAFLYGNIAPASIRRCAHGLLMNLCVLCAYAGYSLEEAAEKNIEKLKKRYPEGFDPERSLHREN